MESRAIPSANDLKSELTFSMSRSSGPGGQNVNKVNSKITLELDVMRSSVLSPWQKEQIMRRLASRISGDGILILTSQENRSMIVNKEAALVKLNELLRLSCTPPKPRKATKPTKTSKKVRLQSKKLHAEKKRQRRRPEG